MAAEKKINGRTFRASKMLATKAIRLQMRLMKAVGPALDKLPAILRGRSGDDVTPEMQAASDSAAIKAFTDIFVSNDSEALAKLVSDIVETAEIMGSSGQYVAVDFDRDFTESFADIVPVGIFVLREQFGDFFSALPRNGALGTRLPN